DPLERTMYGVKLAAAARECGIGFLRFLPAVDGRDVAQLVSIISTRSTAGTMPERIRFGRVGLNGSMEELPGEGIVSFESMSGEQKGRLDAAFDSVSRGEKLPLSGLSAVVGGFLNAFRREANPFLALAPLKAMSEHAFAHSVNVCILNLAQGMSLGLEGEALHDLGIAGLLHEAGKLQLPRQLLLPGRELSPAEREVMATHTELGAGYLLNCEGVPAAAVLAAHRHHMLHDLQGYPPPRPGTTLDLVTEITMISDCFDNLRAEHGEEDRAKISGLMLTAAGSALHPSLTLNFLKTMLEKAGGG
ncbi:MAG TPA: HD domain-containing phosphohydrolase, partial [Verrucomicrobiae bacterium]|nr:HD domain-containing phosphohydrolase [Verrucomicrobiae bacterium]